MERKSKKRDYHLEFLLQENISPDDEALYLPSNPRKREQIKILRSKY